jgi:hypothetical protein
MRKIVIHLWTGEKLELQAIEVERLDLAMRVVCQDCRYTFPPGSYMYYVEDPLPDA